MQENGDECQGRLLVSGLSYNIIALILVHMCVAGDLIGSP